ncbi:hypothetical protein Q1695_013163 [Nippostrongylus brasiliensis]|nr:hypothetical protein Q1695_013163 [Nippostrongylus brasiliensis]
MKKTSTNLKPKHGGAYYEPWMDYKEDLRRTSTASDVTSVAAPESRYRFANEYAESVSKSSTASSRASNRRTTSTTRRNSSPKKASETKPSSSEKTNVKGRSGSVQSVRSIPRTLPPPYSPPRDYTKDKDLIAKIEVEFKAFYSWTINGREDDMTREHIEKLLFPDL